MIIFIAGLPAKVKHIIVLQRQIITELHCLIIDAFRSHLQEPGSTGEVPFQHTEQLRETTEQSGAAGKDTQLRCSQVSMPCEITINWIHSVRVFRYIQPVYLTTHREIGQIF